MEIQKFAKEWIESWNSHDIKKIMNHYSEDIEITTPMIKLVVGINNGTLKGEEAVRCYWTKALESFPKLNFKLVDVTEGVDSIALYYKSVMNKKAIEVMFFNQDDKVNKMIAFYT